MLQYNQNQAKQQAITDAFALLNQQLEKPGSVTLKQEAELIPHTAAEMEADEKLNQLQWSKKRPPVVISGTGANVLAGAAKAKLDKFNRFLWPPHGVKMPGSSATDIDDKNNPFKDDVADATTLAPRLDGYCNGNMIPEVSLRIALPVRDNPLKKIFGTYGAAGDFSPTPEDFATNPQYQRFVKKMAQEGVEASVVSQFGTLSAKQAWYFHREFLPGTTYDPANININFRLPPQNTPTH